LAVSEVSITANSIVLGPKVRQNIVARSVWLSKTAHLSREEGQGRQGEEAGKMGREEKRVSRGSCQRQGIPFKSWFPVPIS
jgi:hypothetical protein